ncbi:MAG: hypothetical protein ACERK6_00675 [Candidatus Aminicenantaceae bacterium]
MVFNSVFPMGLMQQKFSRLYCRALEPANRIPFAMESDRLVLFSDHHKGDRSAADDFSKNSGVYEAALDFYAAGGFRLLVLGDNEELWKNTYARVKEHYSDLITREVDLALSGQDGRKIRIWGNHDKELSLRRLRKTIRMDEKDPLHGIDLREGVCLGPDIFLIHGHQGRFFEDKAWRISRWAVQFIWRTIQRILHIGIDGPMENVAVREGLEMQYYRWAESQRVLMICGHTHRAVFASQTRFDRLDREVRALRLENAGAAPPRRQELDRQIREKEHHMARIQTRHGGKSPRSFAEPAESALPCYFNDGCCGYTNGITCIEIDKGEIRLVKWQHEPLCRTVLVQDDLKQILHHIKTGRRRTGP